jgi:sugar phosphate isomerase/epimerase
MKLGFVSAILPELTLDEVLAFAAQAGYSSVEVMCWPPGKAERRYAGVTHLDAESLDAGAIRELVAKHGVGISGLGYYPNPLSGDPAEAELAAAHLHRLIDAAAELHIGLVNSFVGRDPSLSVEANWPRFLETWRPIIEHAWRPPLPSGEGCSRTSPATASA